MKIVSQISIILLTCMAIFIACNESDDYNSSIIKVAGTSINFGIVEVSQSSVMTYTIAAQDITSAITITTEAPFSVSTFSTTGFTESLDLSPEDFENNPVTIYVRFNPATAGSYSAEITHTSSDRPNVTSVSLSALGALPEPTLTFNPTSMVFNGIGVNESSVQSYNIMASNLVSPLSLATTAPFALSLNETGTFAQDLTLQPDDFASGLITIYVKFTPTTDGTFDASVVHSSNDFSSLTALALNGTTSIVSFLEIEDDFDYAVGNLPAQDRTNDGTINAGLQDWIKVRVANAPIPVVAEGLSYSGYDGAGIGNAVRLDMDAPASNSNVYAYNMEDQQNAGEVGSYYSSFLIKVESLPDGGVFNRPVMFVDWLSNGATKFLGGLTVEYNDGDYRFGVRYQDALTLTNVVPQVGQTYLVVLKNTVTDTNLTNSNNTASVFVFNNESVPATEPTPDAVVTVTAADGNDEYGVKAVAIVKDNNTNGSYIIDGIRVSQLWPELF